MDSITNWLREAKSDLYLPTSKLEAANQVLRRFNRVLVRHSFEDGRTAYSIRKWSDYVEEAVLTNTNDTIVAEHPW